MSEEEIHIEILEDQNNEMEVSIEEGDETLNKHTMELGQSDEENVDNDDDQDDIDMIEAEDSSHIPSALNQKAELKDFELDLGNLLASRTAAIDHSQLVDESVSIEDYLYKIAKEATQSIAQALFSAPSEPCDVGRYALLPPPTTMLPREKPVPQEKKQTKWEKFAQSKGIQKKKRDRLVWDETHQDWRARYGSNRANNTDDIWVVEHKQNEDVSTDPFTKMEQERNERKSKNKKNQVKNLIAASGQRLPGAIDLHSAVQASKTNTKSKAGTRKEKQVPEKALHAKTSLDIAQLSTASMGKFDKLHKDEPVVRAPRNAVTASKLKRAKNRNVPSLGDEKEQNLKLFNRLMDKANKFNVNKAVAQVKLKGKGKANGKRKSRA